MKKMKKTQVKKAVLFTIVLMLFGKTAFSQNFSGKYTWEDGDNSSFTLTLKQSGNNITGSHSAASMLGRESYTKSITGTVSKGIAYLTCDNGACVIKATLKPLTNGQAEWKVNKKSGGQAETDSYSYVPNKAVMKKKQGSTSTQTNQNNQNYAYEPKVSKITGTVKVETYSNEKPYILVLNKAINVIANAEDEAEGINVTVRRISKIQLTSTHGIKLANYKNKKVRVTGTFFGAITAHHHTHVLMDAIKIEILP
jgi:hypothetical protein